MKLQKERILPASKVTSAEKVAQSLKERILAGEFPAGAPLREEELAAYYGVSRHVVREVLRRLSAEGVADYSSFRGARIPLLTPRDVEDIYRARQLIECGSLQIAGHKLELQKLASIHGSFAAAVAEHDWNEAFERDLMFHSFIVEGIGSDQLLRWHSGLLLALKLAHLTVPEFQSLGLQRSVPQHAEVVLAVAAADIERAAAALGKHLADSECLLLLGLQRNGEHQIERSTESQLTSPGGDLRERSAALASQQRPGDRRRGSTRKSGPAR